MNTLNESFENEVARLNYLESRIHLIKSEDFRESLKAKIKVLKKLEAEIREEERLLNIFTSKPEVLQFYLSLEKQENKN